MDTVKADEASAKAAADANGTEKNSTKAGDADGLLKAAEAAANAEKLKANDVVRAVGESGAVKALIDGYDEERKLTVTCKAAAQLMKGADGNDKGRGCVTDAMIAALKCATIPKTPVASEERQAKRGKPRQ